MTARSTASSRTTTSTRQAVQDIKSALALDTTSKYVVNTTPVTGFNSACSVSLIVKTGSDVATVQKIIMISEVVNSTVFGVGFSLGTLRAGYYNGSSYVSSKSVGGLSPNTWYRIVGTWDGTTTALYVNNVTATGSSDPTLSRPAGVLLNASVSNPLLQCVVSSVKIWTRALSATEATNLYRNDTYDATSMWLNWKLDEGAGSIAYDTSGNGNDGTITGATYTSNTPSKARKMVGGNLIPNGDFSYVPKVNVLDTGAATWINGTSSGAGAGNKIFMWALRKRSNASNGAMFDTTTLYNGLPTMKLSQPVTNGWVEVDLYRPGTNPTASDIPDLIPVLPSTSYTYSYWMKTNVTSGTATSGANCAFIEFAGSAGAALATNMPSYVKTTTDWTYYTGSFTTNASTRYLDVEMRIYSNDGAATLVMDAWFSSITLTPTVNTTRTTV